MAELNKYKSIVFLDVDGVLNCQLFYDEYFKSLKQDPQSYKDAKKILKKLVKKNEITSVEYYKANMCPKRMEWLNEVCKLTNSAVVLSASMRNGYNMDEIKEIFEICGATFDIIDTTPYTGYERGTEISKWLKDNCEKWFGVHYFEFNNFVIIDDDNDMLLRQAPNFFQTDSYSGLTPRICEKIINFLNKNKYE